MAYRSIALALVVLAMLPLASYGTSTLISPYAGEQERVVKSLSVEDVDDLLNGRGWGLAKPAELNGVPGPVHLLEMQSEIALSGAQISAIQTIWSRMNQKARELGERYVTLEKELNEGFTTGQVNSAQLQALLVEIGAVRTELRYTHLGAHLEVRPILKPAQVLLYNQLRGYSNDDPCQNIPAGHNPDMWKKHNNCE